MIDWYVILLIAITVLIFHMGEFAGHRDASEYLHLPGKNKVSTGTELMLFRLLTGTFVFIPVYFTVLYGFLAGLVLSVAGTVVLIWFSGKLGKLNDEFEASENRGAFLKARIPARGRVPIFVLLFLAGSEGLIISTVLAISFMKAVFGIPSIWTSSILFFFVFVYAGMGGAGGLQKVGRWLLFGLFGGIMILPIATILIEGVSSIHESFAGLKVDGWHQGTLIVSALLFMFFVASHLLVYYVVSGDLLAVKRTRLKTTLGLTSICWSSMPLAVSVITVYLMVRGGKIGLPGLLSSVNQSFSTILLYVLVISTLSCFSLSIGVSLHNLTSLLLAAVESKNSIRKGYAASLVICLSVVLLVLGLDLEIRDVFIFYINLFISLCLPLWLLLRSRVKWGWELTIIIIVSTVLGDWISFTVGVIDGAGANLAFSGITFLGLFFRKIRKI